MHVLQSTALYTSECWNIVHTGLPSDGRVRRTMALQILPRMELCAQNVDEWYNQAQADAPELLQAMMDAGKRSGMRCSTGTRYVPLKNELKKVLNRWKVSRTQLIKVVKRIRVMREANLVRKCVPRVFGIEPFEFFPPCNAAFAVETPNSDQFSLKQTKGLRIFYCRCFYCSSRAEHRRSASFEEPKSPARPKAHKRSQSLE